jgi:hypothetical protein
MPERRRPPAASSKRRLRSGSRRGARHNSGAGGRRRPSRAEAERPSETGQQIASRLRPVWVGFCFAEEKRRCHRDSTRHGSTPREDGVPVGARGKVRSAKAPASLPDGGMYRRGRRSRAIAGFAAAPATASQSRAGVGSPRRHEWRLRCCGRSPRRRPACRSRAPLAAAAR